jgi:hypothetical protein
MSDSFTVQSVIYMAVLQASGEDDPPPDLSVPSAHSTSERTRSAVHRSGVSHSTREALYSVIDGMAQLEREVHEMRRALALTRSGVELKREIVAIGPDGIWLQRNGLWQHGSRVHCFLSLRVWNGERVLAVTARVHQGEAGAELRFESVRGEHRDILVAFCFQQQAKERRRELDAAADS